MNKVLKNEFSWSVTRDRLFRECPRKYYFIYYGSWGGWEDEMPQRVREIYILKKLKNRAMWIGEVVHDCIARSLENISRGIPVLDLKSILSITRDRMRQDFRNSKKFLYRKNPARYCALFEHEYEVNVSDEEWRAAADQVDSSLKIFYESPSFEQLMAKDPEDFLEIEQFSSFQLEGMKIQIKLDFACKEKNRLVVWDWKTGKSSPTGFSLQMACYAWYAGAAFDEDPTRVITRQFDLHRGKIQEQTFTSGSFDELFSYIAGSIEDMKGLLDDAKANRASEERFSKVKRAPVCTKCNFLRVCRPDI